MVWLAFAAYTAVIVAANLAIVLFGFWPVWPGVMAPSGVYFAGLALGCRDWLQETGGRRLTIAAILLGAGISALLSPGLAVASGLAFLLSESLDMAVYTPIKRRHVMLAVLASNTVGAVVDSCAFLLIAFGSLEFLTGQLIGKGWTTLAALVVLLAWRRWRGNVLAGHASAAMARSH